MESQLIRESLYKRYIEPTIGNHNNYIGVEIEMPIINLKKQPVDFDVVHLVTKDFINHFGFTATGLDDEGNIFSCQSEIFGDILSYDCSYNNLELSFGRENNICVIKERFTLYYKFLQEKFNACNYTLTGMGLNPYRNFNHNVPIPNGRYRMLFHHLNSYTKYKEIPMYFHQYPQFGTFSSASQVQLDVELKKLPLVLNTFTKLEPIKAVLFANSPLNDNGENLLCCRDMFWENSTHGINPHNIGMYNCKFTTEDNILSYIETTSIYCVEKDDKYINFAPTKITDYLNRDEIFGEYFEKGEYKKITFKPSIDDIEYLRTFKFEDLTYRGTVEFRSVCCQPIEDSLTVAAFHLGLMENLEKLSVLMENDHTIYGHGYNATELRKLFVKNELPGFVDEDKLYFLAKQILDLAYEGLQRRNKNEEQLLLPLYKRVDKKTNPAKTMLKLINQSVNLQDIILEYSKI